MQFLLIAYDGKDPDAPARRLKARKAHLAGAKQMKEAGKMLYGAAILDDAGEMAGSMMLVDYPSRGAMQTEWLDHEPYLTGEVWQNITISPCRVPDFCL